MQRVGRPRLPKGKAKRRTMYVRFPADDVKEFKAMAKTEHLTLSEWMRRLAKQAAARQLGFSETR